MGGILAMINIFTASLDMLMKITDAIDSRMEYKEKKARDKQLATLQGELKAALMKPERPTLFSAVGSGTDTCVNFSSNVRKASIVAERATEEGHFLPVIPVLLQTTAARRKQGPLEEARAAAKIQAVYRGRNVRNALIFCMRIG